MAEGMGLGMDFVGSWRWTGVVSIGLFGHGGGSGYGWVNSHDGFGLDAVEWAWWFFLGRLGRFVGELGMQDLDWMEWI